ncbi:MAG: glycosyltransferase [Armatimonadetes bacterium]|nr:glycosyltransferase [Armatimonadota bacterium]
MRFLHVTTFYPPHHHGGDAVYVRRLAEALAAQGHEVEVVHSLDAHRVQKPTPSNGVTVHGLSAPLGAIVAHQTGWPLLYWPALQRILARPFDVIHYHNVSLLGPGILTMGRARKKLYTTHEHWLVCPTHVMWKFGRRACERPECVKCVVMARRPPQFWRYTSMLQRCANHVDHFLAPSRAAAKLHGERGFPRPLEVFPIFAPRAGQDGSRPHGKPYFLVVGRLEKYKGTHTVIPAVQGLDANLLVAGEGPDALSHPQVRYLGRLSEAALGPLYAHAVAVVVPSLTYETFGTVTIEAFAHKTPVIARDLGAVAEPVRDSGGGFTYRTQGELREAMIRLLENPTLRDDLGARGHAMFEKKWAPEPHLDAYLRLVGESSA